MEERGNQESPARNATQSVAGGRIKDQEFRIMNLDEGDGFGVFDGTETG